MVFPTPAATVTKVASEAVTVDFIIPLVTKNLRNSSSLKGSMYLAVVEPNNNYKGKIHLPSLTNTFAAAHLQ